MVNYILICTDGSRTQKNGFIYNMQIKDIYGNFHHIEAIGIDKISSSYSSVKVVNVKKVLSSNMKCKFLTDDKLSRDGGDIHLLVGTDVASLHPEKITNIKDLVIMSTIFGNGYTMMGHNEEHVKVTNKGTDLKVHSVTVEDISKGDSSKISALENKINSLLAINNNLQSQMAVLQNTVEHLTKSAPPLQSHTHNSPTTAMRKSDCKDTKLPSTFRNNYNDVFIEDRKKLLELVRFRFGEKNSHYSNETEKKEEFEDIEKDSDVNENPDDDSNKAEDDEENEHEVEENNDEEGKKEKKDLENDIVNQKYSVFSIQYFLQWCKPFSRN